MPLTARDFLLEVYRRTGIPLVDTVAHAARTRIDVQAREMALTYRMLGYSAGETSRFLKTYYLLEDETGTL